MIKYLSASHSYQLLNNMPCYRQNIFFFLQGMGDVGWGLLFCCCFCLFFSSKKKKRKKEKNSNILFCFSLKTYAVGTHQKCLSETLQISTHNICFCEVIFFVRVVSFTAHSTVFRSYIKQLFPWMLFIWQHIATRESGAHDVIQYKSLFTANNVKFIRTKCLR